MDTAQSKPFHILLKERRRDLKLSQKELARRIHCETDTLSKYERGRLVPPPERFEELCTQLKLQHTERIAFERAWRVARQQDPQDSPIASTPQARPLGEPAPLPRPWLQVTLLVTLFIALPGAKKRLRGHADAYRRLGVGATLGLAILVVLLMGHLSLLQTATSDRPGPHGAVLSIRRKAPCTWNVTLAVTGLRPYAPVFVSDPLIRRYDCGTGASVPLRWGPVPWGAADGSGRWVGLFYHWDYGSYHYVIQSKSVTTAIDVSYGRNAG